MSSSSAYRSDIPALSTVVVKVGSRILATKGTARQPNRMEALVEDVAALHAKGIRCVIVTSGAIARGMEALNLARRPATIPMRQACASVGQIRLMHAYHDLFGAHGVTVGQVLLTWDDLRSKQRYLNLRNTLFSLLDKGAIPIVNENDSIGIDEIRFGDNDTLGAQISMCIAADMYVMLSDVNGLYDKNPATHKDAVQIPTVARLTPQLFAAAGANRSDISVGGMITKLRAADMVTRSGIHAIVGNGFDHRLSDVLATPTLGTVFMPRSERLSARERWITFTRTANAAIVVDDGAKKAIVDNGKSLLPAGVRSIKGSFKSGDLVSIVTESGETIAHGLTNYASDEAGQIKGLKNQTIRSTFPDKSFDEIVHRDNMVIVTQTSEAAHGRKDD